MQKELNGNNSQTLDRLIQVLEPHLPMIMNDSYGNYFSQKLIQSCTANQRLIILKAVDRIY